MKEKNSSRDITIVAPANERSIGQVRRYMSEGIGVYVRVEKSICLTAHLPGYDTELYTHYGHVVR